MNQEEYDNLVRDLDIQKRQAELKSISSEYENSKQSYFLKPANWIALLTGIIGIIAAIAQYQNTEGKVQAATSQYALKTLEIDRKKFQLEQEYANLKDEHISNQKELNNLKSESQKVEFELSEKKAELSRQQELLTQLEKQINQRKELVAAGPEPLKVQEIDQQIQQTVKELKTPRVVYLQFRGDLTRELMNTLKDYLSSQGIPTPGVERVSGDYGNAIRYYHDSDKQKAEQLRDLVIKFFSDKGCPIPEMKIHDISGTRFVAEKGQLEIWLHHSCR
jgi:DNA repair exonuclease SbcCD ATPase subunit